MAQVTILRGTYRNFNIQNGTFRLVQDVREGARGMYVTVEDNGTLGQGEGKEVRVRISSREDITVTGQSVADMSDSEIRKASKDDNVFSIVKPAEPEVYKETEEEAIERIRERFDILDQMAEGCTTGAVRAMIVSRIQ